MPGVKITGAEYAIKDIFREDFLFEIPAYQRPYSWTTDQAELQLSAPLHRSVSGWHRNWASTGTAVSTV